MGFNIKNTILRLLEGESKQKVVALYGGGFKPPTRGHFAVVEKALSQKWCKNLIKY